VGSPLLDGGKDFRVLQEKFCDLWVSLVAEGDCNLLQVGTMEAMVEKVVGKVQMVFFTGAEE